MKKALASVASWGAAMLLTSAAMAEGGGIPMQNNFVIGAERMMGFYSYKGTMDADGTDFTTTGTQFSLLFGANQVGTAAAEVGEIGLPTNPSATPRLAGDYMINDLVSIGGSLGYYTSSGEAEAKGNGFSDSVDTPELSALAVAPRVGFMIPIGYMAAFWPRGGVTYVKASSKSDANGQDFEQNTTIQQLTLEGMFFIGPVEHFGFVVGPVIDIGVGGEVEYKAGNQSYTYDGTWTSFGGVAGIAGYL